MNTDVHDRDRLVEKHSLQAVIAILIIHALMLGWSATWQSPTLNEPGHLASGIALWKLGRYDAYRVNPPLIRTVAAAPIMLMGCKTNWNQLSYGPGVRCEFNIGMDYVKANGLDSIWQFNLARWICIPFSLLGGWSCYLWGRDLCGKLSGVFACGLWCFNPNVLAYGQVITPDMGGASIELMASYLFWQWLRQPSWKSATSAGILFGLALLAKSTWIFLFAVWPFLWVMAITARWWATPSKPRVLIQAGQLVWILSVAIYLLNLGYLFEGTMTPLGDFQFVSQALGHPAAEGSYGNIFAERWLGNVPVPFPKEFVLGIDHQKKDFENFSLPSYLRGEWRMPSWWYYYLYGFLVKMPVGLLGLGLLASIGSIMQFKRGNLANSAGWAALCVPGVLTVLVVSSQPTLNHHFRYVLPAFGPLFVFASTIPLLFHSCQPRVRKLVASVSAVCAVSIVCSTVCCAPGFISYFNVLAGGARQGHHHLLHSNLDWGQDLYYLKDWIKETKPDSPLHVAYYGLFDPKALGIDYIPAPCGPNWGTPARSAKGDAGLYAISINYVMGDRAFLSPDCDYQYLQHETPVHICGDSIYIYRMP